MSTVTHNDLKTIELFLSFVPYRSIVNSQDAENSDKLADRDLLDMSSRLGAWLAIRFGPELLKRDGKLALEFPGGSFVVSRREKVRKKDQMLCIWCEIFFRIDAQEAKLLDELRNHKSLEYISKKKVIFIFDGTMDFDRFAQAVFAREIKPTHVGKNAMTFEEFDDNGAAVSVISSDDRVSVEVVKPDEIDVDSALAPIFNYLDLGAHIKLVAKGKE